MTFVSSVTAALSAMARPVTIDAPVFSVTEVFAMIVPLKAVLVPSVADVPTCQKTFFAEAPLINCTLELVAVMSVVGIWNTNTAFELPWPSRTRVVVNEAEAGKQYTPGARVPFKLGEVVLQGRPARSF